MARARPRPRPPRRLRRDPPGHDPRPRRPRATADGANPRRRLPARLERLRDGARRGACRRAGARGRRARLGGRRPLRAARTDRRRRARRRRPPLLAVQVLRPSPRSRVRPRGAPAVVASVQGAAGGRRAGGKPVRDGDARARAARRLRRRGRVSRVSGLGRDPVARARARAALPRRAARPLHALRPPDHGGPGTDLRVPGRRSFVPRSCRAAGRARDRGLGRRLLRRRADDAAGAAAGGNGARRLRPLQHVRRGRPAARRRSRRRCPPSRPSRPRPSADRGGGSGPARVRAARRARP